MYLKEYNVALKLIKEAAKIVLDGFYSTLNVEIKGDGSPVTQIDKKVDTFLREGLKKEFHEYGFLTEETEDDLSRLEKDYIWVIDPIDGTKEFINKKYEFVILVALVYKGEPVLGLIAEPLSGEIYYAIKGEGSYLLKGEEKIKLHVSDKRDNLIALTSPFHETEEEKEYVKAHQKYIKELRYCGAGYKACQIASGKADVCYRFTCKCKEWDTAAPQIIVTEAGGYFLDGEKKEIKYNKEDVYNHHGYLIVNKKDNIF